MFNITKTTQERARDTAAMLQQMSVSVVENYKANYQELFNTLWQSENPQLVFDAFGTGAVALFQSAQRAIEHIITFDPAYVPPTPPYEYVINGDGTVTVGERIPEPEPEPETENTVVRYIPENVRGADSRPAGSD